MTIQHKVTGRASSVPAGLAVGAVVSVLVTTAICMIGGWMIGSEMIAQDKIGYCSITALLASAIVGSIVAAKKIQRKRLLIALASGGIYYAVLVAATIVFFDGEFQGMGVTFITVLIGTLVPVLLSNRRLNRRPAGRCKKIRR